MNEGEPVPQEESETAGSSESTPPDSKAELRKLTLELTSVVQTHYPEYSQQLDHFSRTGKICLYQEGVELEFGHPAINLVATRKKIGYVLGHVTQPDNRGRRKFNYKNLPRLIPRPTQSGVIAMDHPPTDWYFDANDISKKSQSTGEMLTTLALLRENNIF